MAEFKIEPRKIVEGFSNLAKEKMGIPDQEIEDMYQERMKICNTCSSKTDNDRCSECGCILEAKGRSPLSDCPLNKWKKD